MKHPQTADGVPMVLEMSLYTTWSSEQDLTCWSIAANDVVVCINGDGDTFQVPRGTCYSTLEARKSAKETE